jgi:hypothetical protein
LLPEQLSNHVRPAHPPAFTDLTKLQPETLEHTLNVFFAFEEAGSLHTVRIAESDIYQPS